MAFIFGAIIYFAVCLLVGRWAQMLKRNGNAYMFLSIFFSPLLMAIILAFLGTNKMATAEEERQRLEKRRLRDEYKTKINSMWRNMLKDNGFSQHIELFEKNKIDNYDVIMALNEQDLAAMGIETVGDRKRIIQMFRDYARGPFSERKM